MNILGVGLNYFAFAGKTAVYVRGLPRLTDHVKNEKDGVDERSLDLPAITFPAEWIAKDGHIECIAISSDDKLVAVSDSLHGLYLFMLESVEAPKWIQIFSRSSNKRVIKLEFTSDKQYLTFLDKQGDIYAIRIPKDYSRISNTKKIMGHTSFISDYVIRPETKQIFSCDRDEKIRISNFPDAFVIQGFKLGHTESVINIASLAVQHKDVQRCFLLSISLTGMLLLWNLDKPISGTETDYVKAWSIKELLPEKVREAGVKLMKAICVEDDVYSCIAFTGSTTIYIFRMSTTTFEIDLLQKLETESESIVMEWYSHNKETLLVYTPDTGTIRHWKSGDETLQSDLYSFDDLIVSDMKASTESLKIPVVPMKKRLTNFEDSTVLHQDKVSM